MADDRDLMILSCPCGQKMKVPARAMGKSYRCVKCGDSLLVGAENTHPMGKAAAKAPEKAETEPHPERIGGMLVDAGLVTAKQLQEALRRQKAQGGKTFEILIALGHLDPDQLHLFLSKQPGVANIDLSRVTIDRELLKLIPKALALEHLVLPVDQLGKLLTVAMACPLDAVTIQEVELRTGLKVKAMLCKLADIHEAVKKYFPDEEPENAAQVVMFPGVAAASREDLSEKIAETVLLPVADDVLDCIQAMVQDPESNLREIAAMCGSDPALAAVLLQAANSPIYALPGRVESIDLAVILLGKEGIGATATRCQQNPHNDQAAIVSAERARRCSAGAGALARNTGKSEETTAQTAGLLFEFGCVVLAALSPIRYGEIDPALAGAERMAEERKRFSHSHADAGPALATYWRFPRSLILAMQNYCKPAEAGEYAELAGIVGLAAIGAARGEELTGEDFRPLQQTLEALRLGAGEAAALLREAAPSK